MLVIERYMKTNQIFSTVHLFFSKFPNHNLQLYPRQQIDLKITSKFFFFFEILLMLTNITNFY